MRIRTRNLVLPARSQHMPCLQPQLLRCVLGAWLQTVSAGVGLFSAEPQSPPGAGVGGAPEPEEVAGYSGALVAHHTWIRFWMEVWQVTQYPRVTYGIICPPHTLDTSYPGIGALTST